MTQPLSGKSVMTDRERLAWRWANRLAWITLGLSVCVLASIVGNLYQAGQPKLIPEVVMIDPEGIVLWRSSNGQLSPQDIDIGAILQQWVWHSRRRGDDALLMGEMRRKAELMTTGNALRHLQRYYAQTHPKCQEDTPECRERKRNPIRTIIRDITPTRLSDREWRLTWTEVWTPTYGGVSRTLKVSAEITVERRLTPGPFGRLLLTVRDVNRSPLGVYVTDYQLSETWEGMAP